MIIVLKPDCTDEQIEHIEEQIVALGLKPELSRGVQRTLVGVIGEEDVLRNAPLGAFPGVEKVTRAADRSKVSGVRTLTPSSALRPCFRRVVWAAVRSEMASSP